MADFYVIGGGQRVHMVRGDVNESEGATGAPVTIEDPNEHTLTVRREGVVVAHFQTFHWYRRFADQHEALEACREALSEQAIMAKVL